MMVYGSYARGDYSKNSDIDLAILLDSKKFCHSDACKLIQYVGRAQKRYGVKVEPDFILDSEIELFNRGIFLDGRAFSDVYMYMKDGIILLGEDFRHLLAPPDSTMRVEGIQFDIIEEHFKRWLLHNLDSRVPNWFVSWSIVTAVNMMGSTRVGNRDESFGELERLLPSVRDLPTYRKFKSNSKKRKVLGVDEFLKLLKALESSVVTRKTPKVFRNNSN